MMATSTTNAPINQNNLTTATTQTTNNSNNNDKQQQYDYEMLVNPVKTMVLFEALQNIDIEQLQGKDILSVLPSLTRLLLSPTFIKKQQLFKLLYPIKKMNDVMQLMLAKNIQPCGTADLPPESSFESCNCNDKLRLVAAEYINIHGRARQSKLSSNPNSKLLQSTLFDNPIYADEVSYCLCILLLKSTNNPIVNIVDMSEALLHVKYGTTYIIRLVANMPDFCNEICHSLINHGERQDEGPNFNEISEQRSKALRLICAMNPSIAFTVRSLTLQSCKMPSLTIMITLDQLTESLERYSSLGFADNNMTDDSTDAMDTSDDSVELRVALKGLEDSYDSAVAFITGILLGVDDGIRSWFAQYTKSAQQKRIDQGHHTIISKFRSQLLACITDSSIMLLADEILGNEDSLKMDAKLMNRKLIRATATLRLFCALRGIGSLKLNPDESDALLRLITCKLPVNQTSVNFATTGVCTLLVCSALINNSKEERRAAEWLKWLIRESNYSDTRYLSHGKCSISELLLLIATHFQNNQNNQIAELICATLGMKLQIKASVSKCKSLFVQEVFNDQMVAEHAVKVPVTKNLNNNIIEFLPIHCIHQLLESRSFSKHQIPIKDWIYAQICESKKPIHVILPKLIEAYVNSVIISTSVHGHCGTNEPIAEEDIARVFKTQLYSVSSDETSTCEMTNGIKENINTKNEKKKVKKEKLEQMDICEDDQKKIEPNIVDVEAAQVLMLYYLVLYEDVRLKKNSDLTANERAKLVKYSPDFMMNIPIFYLLQLVRDNQNSFGIILPCLMKLVTTQYPQLCSIQHWLTIEHYEPYHSNINDNNSTTSSSQEASAFKRQIGANRFKNSTDEKLLKVNLMKQLIGALEKAELDPLVAAQAMQNVTLLRKEEIWPFVDPVISNLSRILNLDISRNQDYKELVQVTTKLWWKFNTICPRKLWVLTVNALKKPQNLRTGQEIRPVEYTWDELALDPLIVLRCDTRVFRCVDGLNIILHILTAFLAASRRCLQDQINELPSNQKDLRSLEELMTTLILAQTSAAIQILLEFCLPSDVEQNAINKREYGFQLDLKEKLLSDEFEASVNCICEHLHQVFIADTNLAKLVHFQTYPSDLLATTSDRIPSMHICLDFIPELLSQPDIAKQVFVIELTSHLCEKYAITKSLNVAKLCFNVAYTLLQLLPSERRASFFIPVLPALMRICKVFPILREDANLILCQIEQITFAHMASTSSRLSLGSVKPFEGLEKMSWREAKELMRTLDSNEALYLCIQKVLVS